MKMKKSVFCSIITPVYNAEKYLQRCIDSILNQNFQDYELILIDDGSVDQSGEICEKYAGKYGQIKVIHQENQGHTSARNSGLAIAQGEYIVFVDSDDWIEPNLLSDCYEKVTENNYPDIVLYGFRRVMKGENIDRKQPYREGAYNKEDIKKELLPSLLTSGRFSLSERMMKKELVIEYQKVVNPKIKLGEDMLCCTVSLANAQSVYVLNGIYYNYFQHNDSIIHSYANYTFDDWRMNKEIMVQYLADDLEEFNQQLGYCSIRFLDRAVIGEIEREGLSLKSVSKLKTMLNEFPEIQWAKDIPKKKNIAIKYFCLKNKLMYLHYIIFKMNQFLHK